MEQAELIRERASEINELIQTELGNPEFYELVAGKANTRGATLNRAQKIERLIESGVGS